MVSKGVKTWALSSLVTSAWSHELVYALVTNVLCRGIKWGWAGWKSTSTLWRSGLPAFKAVGGCTVQGLEVEEVWEGRGAGHEAAYRQELHRGG